MYLYELPTTGAISFSDFCVDHTINNRHTVHIPAVTQARANLRAALKDSKRTDHAHKDYLQLVKIIDEYIPQLRGIMSSAAHDEIGLKSEPSFSWRSTLSANMFHNSPRLDFPGLHADLAFTLLTYAFALSNLGRSTALSLGRYERDRAISEAERKEKDGQLNVAVDFLCRASGIFTYIADNVLPEWETNIRGGPTGFEKPPDLSREVITALAKMSLADAQSLAIRKLLSIAAYDSNIVPGPPLPLSHPSPAFIAKLHLECTSLYSSARSLVKTSGARKRPSSPSESSGDVSSELRRYLADEAAFHGAVSRKWLGVQAGEKGGTERGGDAVGFMAWARKELEELKDGGRGISIAKGDREMRERFKQKVSDELESVNVFYKYYKKANDTLHFQPVPTQADLQARIPAGIMVKEAKPYVPPVPAFGPGSVAHIQNVANELELGNEGEGGRPPDTASPPVTSTYAGAGSYF
ncbi:pH-response regulator protein palC [Hypsizygus marmoreus]|uniref:pH-response regulator protein palC n=1 Tax=Hypsizygus marmoreus TaxID=39966 RepID=A0A369K296_HYPMA|nr:pH-response regulator protein palC [Hypsizygus marmoreus]